MQHLLFSCQVSNHICTAVKAWIGLRRSMSTLDSAAKWLKKEVRGSSWQAKAKRIAFACTVYQIWMNRNKKLFEGSCLSAQGSIHLIKTHVYRIIYGNFPHVTSIF